jgi:hypothetical protein
VFPALEVKVRRKSTRVETEAGDGADNKTMDFAFGILAGVTRTVK